jgi:hypothetical protein
MGTRVVAGSAVLAFVGAALVLFSGCSDASSDPANAAGSGAANAGGSGGEPSACKAERATHPSAPALSALDADTVARAAAVIGACIPDDGVARNAAYLWAGQASSGRTYYRYAMQLDCLAHAACGCSAVERCLGLSEGPSSSCSAGCNGDVFTACGPEQDLPDGFRVTVDCSSVAQRCDPAGACIDGAPIACDKTFVNGCNAAGQPEACDSGLVRHGPTCSDLGLDCVAGACVGRGAACTGESSDGSGAARLQGVACAGNKLSACANGKLTTIDCATRGPGFGCQSVGSAFFCGLAADCTPANETGIATPTECSGSTLEFCNAGRVEHIDCRDLGFTACVGKAGCTSAL